MDIYFITLVFAVSELILRYRTARIVEQLHLREADEEMCQEVQTQGRDRLSQDHTQLHILEWFPWKCGPTKGARLDAG